jgi:hypothetical protein
MELPESKQRRKLLCTIALTRKLTGSSLLYRVRVYDVEHAILKLRSMFGDSSAYDWDSARVISSEPEPRRILCGRDH